MTKTNTATKKQITQNAIPAKKADSSTQSTLKKVEQDNQEKEKETPVQSLSAAQKLEKKKTLDNLQTKFEHLKEKKEEFERFAMHSDGTNEKLVLHNGKGQRVEASNSEVVRIAVGNLSQQLEEKYKATEQEILSFQF
jgi:hypothetical protein